MLFRERRAELHVEVLRQPTASDHSLFIPHTTIEEKVLEWLHKTFAGFFINTYVDAPNSDIPPYAHLIKSIRIVDYSGPGSPHDYHALDEVTPVVRVYMPREPEESPKEQRAQRAQHLDLPSKALAGIWDSLTFDTIDPNQILRSLARISTVRSRVRQFVSILTSGSHFDEAIGSEHSCAKTQPACSSTRTPRLW